MLFVNNNKDNLLSNKKKGEFINDKIMYKKDFINMFVIFNDLFGAML